MALWQAQTGQVQGLERVHVDLRDSWKTNTATGVIDIFSPKRLVGGDHVARIWDTRNAYKISNGNSKATGNLEVLDMRADSKVFVQIYRGNGFICMKHGAESTVMVRTYHGLPGCDTLQSGRRVSLFQTNKLPPSSRYILWNAGNHVAAYGVPWSRVLICRRRGTVSE